MADRHSQPVSDHLTQRELEIVRLMADGLSNQEIAARLFITLHTIKWYLKQIYGKLQVDSRTQAIAVAHTARLLDRTSAKVELSPPKHNLPYQPTAFIGRTDELNHIAGRLADPVCRLLTLVGPGGIGKTRLAIQAAGQQIGKFKHGVYFVALAPIASPNVLALTIGNAAQYSFYGQQAPEMQLLGYLRDKHMLLLLDNFEHLMAGVGLLLELLSRCPHVKLLVTSRERLNVQAEWALHVQGLSYPHSKITTEIERYSAVNLFVQSALRIDPAFSLTKALPFVLGICQQVEGMPLGLELAASWLRLMPCDEIVAQLKCGIDLLTTTLRDVPERQRSLRAVFDHSWNLLSEAERSVLRKLSVFRGGFDLEAAGAIAGASLLIVAGLVDKSLVRFNPEGRHDLHELLRQYAAEKLADAGEAATTAHRHLNYFLNVAEAAEADVYGPNQMAVHDRLEREHDNLRAGLGWALSSGHIEAGLRFAGSLFWFWFLRFYWREAHEWYSGLLAVQSETSAGVRAKALHRAAELEGFLLNIKQVKPLAEEALQLSQSVGDKWNTAWAVASLASYYWWSLNIERAFKDQEAALVLFRETGDQWGISHSLRRLALFMVADGRHDQAASLAQEALDLARAAGSKSAIAWSLYTLASAEPLRDLDLQRMEALFRESLILFQEQRDKWPVALTLSWLGHVYVSKGDVEQADAFFRECIALGQEMDSTPAICEALFLAASLALNRGRAALATTLLSVVEPYVKDVPDVRPSRTFARQMEAAQAQLDSVAFNTAWAKGQAMSLNQAAGYARQASSSFD